MIYMADAILYKWPGCPFSMQETYDSLVWESLTVQKPSLDEVNLAIKEYQEYSLSISYKLQRKKNYPSIENQLEALWDAMDSGEIPKASEFYDSIKSVKDQYPKPN